jgi:hypothetical protein
MKFKLLIILSFLEVVLIAAAKSDDQLARCDQGYIDPDGKSLWLDVEATRARRNPDSSSLPTDNITVKSVEPSSEAQLSLNPPVPVEEESN